MTRDAPAHISLFAGIGCDFLGSRSLGYMPVAHSEIEPHLRALLNQRFPKALDLGDVKNVNAGALAKAFGTDGTLVSGGFPCQDISAPGYGPHRTGGEALDGTRSGLYVELMRVVREAQPQYVMIENVALLRRRGLGVLLHDLYEAGYDARWDSIPAAYFGAPHLRDRLFIGAVLRPYRKTDRPKPQKHPDTMIGAAQRGGVFGFGQQVTSFPRAGNMENGLVRSRTPITVKEARGGRKLMPTPTASDGTGGPGTSPKREGGMNLRTHLGGSLNPPYVEWMMGVPFGWTDPSVTNDTLQPFDGWYRLPECYPTLTARTPGRGRRIKALGNALVPDAFELSLSRLIDW